jgi:hypothetical protein
MLFFATMKDSLFVTPSRIGRSLVGEPPAKLLNPSRDPLGVFPARLAFVPNAHTLTIT